LSPGGGVEFTYTEATKEFSYLGHAGVSDGGKFTLKNAPYIASINDNLYLFGFNKEDLDNTIIDGYFKNDTQFYIAKKVANGKYVGMQDVVMVEDFGYLGGEGRIWSSNAKDYQFLQFFVNCQANNNYEFEKCTQSIKTFFDSVERIK
jgi:hypothetical protein